MTSFNKVKSSFLIIALLAASSSLHAQLEVTHLFLKGQSATGFGAYLHAGFPVSQGDEVSGEFGLAYFAPGEAHLVFVPLVAGYRHTFDGSGAGFYAEPFAGYCIGATDIQMVDANGDPVYNPDGSVVYAKLNGPVAGLGFGYIIPSSKCPINFGLRFQHVFVSELSPNILALRISWSILIGRRWQQQ